MVANFSVEDQIIARSLARKRKLKPRQRQEAMTMLDVFKGQQDKDGQVVKVCSFGYLMNEGNAGLIQLEWDVYGNSDIYLDLSKLATERRVA